MTVNRPAGRERDSTPSRTRQRGICFRAEDTPAFLQVFSRTTSSHIPESVSRARKTTRRSVYARTITSDACRRRAHVRLLCRRHADDPIGHESTHTHTHTQSYPHVHTHILSPGDIHRDASDMEVSLSLSGSSNAGSSIELSGSSIEQLTGNGGRTTCKLWSQMEQRLLQHGDVDMNESLAFQEEFDEGEELGFTFAQQC